MASYKYPQFLVQNDSDSFDSLHAPGQQVPFSGIYRCNGCGREIAANYMNPFPPQNHHQHTPAQGPISWRLIVWANHNPK